MISDGRWSLSIVSHGHGQAISKQLRSLSLLPSVANAELIITLNLPGEYPPDVSMWPGSVRWVRNREVQSYGRNHNQALADAKHDYFAILDPDLEWERDPFPSLQALLDEPDVALVAPCVKDEQGNLADHARPAPTPWSVVRRRLFGGDDGLPAKQFPHAVPWLAGLFLATSRVQWTALRGFDQTYRLYAEDVELGLRCWGTGRRVIRHPLVAVTHFARRESKSNLLRLVWHMAGLMRLWRSTTWHTYWQEATQNQLRKACDLSSQGHLST